MLRSTGFCLLETVSAAIMWTIDLSIYIVFFFQIPNRLDGNIYCGEDSKRSLNKPLRKFPWKTELNLSLLQLSKRKSKYFLKSIVWFSSRCEILMQIMPTAIILLFEDLDWKINLRNSFQTIPFDGLVERRAAVLGAIVQQCATVHQCDQQLVGLLGGGGQC